MPMGNGWFMDLRNYELIPITEHFYDVLANPKRFRLKPSEVNRKSRDKTLINVLKHGFARVRMVNPGMVEDFTLEGWGSWDDIMSGVLAFAQKKRLKKSTYVTMANIKTGDVRQEFLEDIVSGELKSSRFANVRKYHQRTLIALARALSRSVAIRRGVLNLKELRPSSYGRQLLMALALKDSRRAV